MSRGQSRYAIAYDVSSDRLRRQVRSVCRRYGARQQYSLFEVRLSPTERAELVKEFQALVEDAEGTAHVRIYSVGPRSDDIDVPEELGTDDDDPANIV